MRPTAARILLCACVALALASCRSTPEITGRVTPRTRVTLPENAVLEVQVADVSSADAAPIVVAWRAYSPLGAAPWHFTLGGRGVRALDPDRTYAVQARVMVDGKPRLVSKRRTVIDPARLGDTLVVVVDAVPRTIGARLDEVGTADPLVWNPPEGPATLPAPFFPPAASLAVGPEAGPAAEPPPHSKRP